MHEKNALGLWLLRLAVDRCITMADVARDLDVSPSLLSLITRDKRSVPSNLYDKIIAKYHPKGQNAYELEEAFKKLDYEGSIMSRTAIPYAVCKVVDKQTWTKEMMRLFASCVNKMSPEEVIQYKQQFKEISERQNQD